jgi:plasmid maintenance system antidote protein VapI
LKGLTKQFGEARIAQRMGISRNTLRKMIQAPNKTLSVRGVQKIARTSAALQLEQSEINSANGKLRGLTRDEASRVGMAELARRLGVCRVSLSYFVNGKRELTGGLAVVLRGLFREPSAPTIGPLVELEDEPTSY